MKPDFKSALTEVNDDSEKTADSFGPAQSEESASEADELASILVRTKKPAHFQMRRLALEEGTTMQALMLEGMNHVFVKRGRLPIA